MARRGSDTVLADIERRFAGFAVPEGIFDPSTATADQLMKFGLPPKPDPECQPLLRRAWDIGFGKPLRLQAFEVERGLVEQAEYGLFEKKWPIFLSTETTSKSAPTGPAPISPPIRTSISCKYGEPGTIPGNLQVATAASRADRDTVCLRQLDRAQRATPLSGTITAPNGHRVSPAAGQHHDGAGMDAVVGERQRSPAPVPLGFSVAPGDRILSVLTASDPDCQLASW